MIDIRPIRSVDEASLVHKLAAADNHIVPFVSHKVTKATKIIGALSVMPMVLVWVDTQHKSMNDALQVEAYFTGWLANASRTICVPCTPKSPFLPYMKEQKYLDVGNVNLFIKEI
jgi:hypothetical protein